MSSNKDLILVLSEWVLLEYSKLALGETIVDYCRSEDILATKHRSLQCNCHEINEIKVLVRPVCACGCPGWSESSLGAHALLLVLSRCCSDTIHNVSSMPKLKECLSTLIHCWDAVHSRYLCLNCWREVAFLIYSGLEFHILDPQ